MSFSLHRVEGYVIRSFDNHTVDMAVMQSKSCKARAAAILRCAGMADADISAALGVNVRTLQRWRSETRADERSIRAQFDAFRAATLDVD